MKAREGELKWLKKEMINWSFAVFFGWLTPMLITVVIFITYVLTGHEMTTEIAFTLIPTVIILDVIIFNDL